MKRTEMRMLWLLHRLTSVWHPHGFAIAWESDLVDAFLDEFPEARKATTFYTMGSHSVPMLNRAATRARAAGYVTPGVIGNESARQYNQRTWCRTWTITPAGRAAVAS